LNADIARDLAPLHDAVRKAENALDAANKSTAAPLESLAAAGRLIGALQALTARQNDLLNVLPPHSAAEWNTVQLQIQGRLRQLRNT
jgi:Na+/H+-translocating membrane pyrophosphatase